MVNWGVIGLGRIAWVFCNAVQFSKRGQVRAVASRRPDRAKAFAQALSIPTAYESYDALLADDSVHAVYVATMTPGHLEWVIRAARARKHILVEKPMGMNHRETFAMIAAAKEHDVFLMEALMYRCHPQTQKLAALIQQKVIGDVIRVRSAFGFRATPDARSRLFDHALAGGSIMDIGCYPVSAARLVAGAATGAAFLDPVAVKGTAIVGETGVDHQAAVLLEFKGGIIAEIGTSITCELPGEIAVFGSAGTLRVPNPWLASTLCFFADRPVPRDAAFPGGVIELRRGKDVQMIEIGVDRDLYTYQADMAADHITGRQAPAVSWSDSDGNARVLDEWRRQAGLRFPQDDAQ